jgi:cellulose biosynthesis protein BcsQ
VEAWQIKIKTYRKLKKIVMTKKARICAFASKKGGAGKTTTGILTASALTRPPYNYKVLMVDCDEQGSTMAIRRTDQVNVKSEIKVLTAKKENTTNKALKGKYDKSIEQLENVFNDSLDMHHLKDLYTEADAENKLLVDVLADNEEKYDYIFLDMPGQGVSRYIKKILSLTEYAIVPTQPDELVVAATLQFQKLLQGVKDKREKYGFDFIIHGMYNLVENTTEDKHYIQLLNYMHKNHLTTLKMNPKLWLNKRVGYRKGRNTYESLLHNKEIDKVTKEEFSTFLDEFLLITNNHN